MRVRFVLVLLAAAFARVAFTAPSLADVPAAIPARAGERSAATLRFDGTDTAPIAHVRTWQQALFELRREDPSLPDPIAHAQRALAQSGPEVVPIAVIHLTTFGTIFVASALREQTHRGGDVVMTLERANWSGSVPPYIAIDCDDGAGFRAASLDARIPVHYATLGTRTLRLRTGASATSYREARFTFRVLALGTPLPDDTLHVTGTVPYAGALDRGDAYVYLAPGHTRIVNPVVVVEGFDLANDQNWDELYALLNREELLERIRAHGFDVVVLNFADATDYLQRNAFVLVALLQQLHATIGPGTPFTLVGSSTGGVIARYALSWMESNGIPHGVNTFISMDAPHLGADVPLGIQHWFHFFANLASEAAYFVERLDRPAARQILLYHMRGTSGLTPRADAMRTQFLQEIEALGWPGTPRTVAIANGSGMGQGQGFADGDPLLLYRYSSSVRRIDGNVWAVANQRPGVVFQGGVTVLVSVQNQTVTLVGARPLDNAPGGYRNTMLQMDTTAVPYGDIQAVRAHHCFVPTVSALALETPDLFHAPRSGTTLPAPTPFDTIYCPAENQEHVMVTRENASWIEQEILRSARVAVGISVNALPVGAALGPMMPNPFSSQSRITFHVPEPQHVRLAVHDLEGRRIATLADAVLPAGQHAAVWRGESERGGRAPTGVYFVRLEAGDRTSVGRITRLE